MFHFSGENSSKFDFLLIKLLICFAGMEMLLRLAAALQSLVRILSGPIFWLANLRPAPACPPIKEPLVLLSATQIAAKIRTGQVKAKFADLPQ
jgi:hypothetical protein